MDSPMPVPELLPRAASVPDRLRCGVPFRAECKCGGALAVSIGATEEIVLAAQSDGAKRPLGGRVIDLGAGFGTLNCLFGDCGTVVGGLRNGAA